MSAESAESPRSFDQFEGLNTIAGRYGDAVAELIDAHIANGGEMISQQLEMAQPSVVSYARYLSTVLCGEQADEAAHAVSYRAVHFALITATQFKSSQPLGDFKGYYQNRHDHEAMRAKIEEDTQIYMGRSPHLDRLVSRYVPELDPTGEYPHVAETVVALVYLHIDEQAHEQFIDAQVAAWGQTLPDAI